MGRIQFVADHLQQLSAQIADLQRSVEQIRQQVENQLSETDAAAGTEVSQEARTTQEAPPIYVNSALCRGCGICAQTAPNTFRLNPNSGLAEVVDPSGDPPQIVQQAMARCPTGAITSRR